MVFGYWREHQDDEDRLPWPIVTVSPDTCFLEELTAVEGALARGDLNGGVMAFMGRSVSRLTGERLGAREFFVCDDDAHLRYVWPEDFGPHYLAAGVAVPDGFMNLISGLVCRLSTADDVNEHPSLAT